MVNVVVAVFTECCIRLLYTIVAENKCVAVFTLSWKLLINTETAENVTFTVYMLDKITLHECFHIKLEITN